MIAGYTAGWGLNCEEHFRKEALSASGAFARWAEHSAGPGDGQGMESDDEERDRAEDPWERVGSKCGDQTGRSGQDQE